MMLYILLLPEQHSILAVDRNDKLRPHGFDHYLDVLLRCVARNVNETSFLLDNVRTPFVEVTDEPTDVLFVTRYDPCRKDDRVTPIDLETFVRGRGKIPKRRTHLALRTGNQITDLVIIH